MPVFLKDLFDTGDFMPHGHCYLWNAALVRLHFTSDLAIGLAYLAISLTLVHLVRRAKGDIPFSWVFLCFGTFIIACGGTHFMEIWTLWTPIYWVSGAVKFVTATASVITALLLPPLVPKTLALIHAARLWESRKMDLESANAALWGEIGDRKRAEDETRLINTNLEQRVAARTAELAEANQRLAGMAALVEDSNDAIISLDPHRCILSWNPAAERLYGYRMEEILGRPLSLLAPGDLADETDELIERLNRGERIESFETTRIRKTGERIQVALTLSIIRNAAGEIEGASHISRNITDRKRAEEMFRLAVDAAPNAMVMVDGEGIIILVNAQTEKMFGYRREELMGREVDILLPEEYRGRHPVHRAEFMHEPQVRAMGAGRELYGLRKDGTKFPVEIGLNPIHTDQGTWVLSAIVDISERKRGEEMFRLAVDAAPNAMVMVDGKGIIILVNAQTEKMFGYRREEIMGREVDILLPEEYRGRHPAHRAEFMREPRVRAMGAGRELYGLRKDGTKFPVEIGLNPIHTDQGTWVLSAIVDISERKRADEEIKSLNQDLERRVVERTAELGIAISELESFSYSVSHDLRAPLRQISGFSKILVEECESELSADSRKYLMRVHEGAQQMGCLIDDLLNFAKIGRQPLTRRLTHLRTVIDQALEVLNPECTGRVIKWQIDSLWRVECDPGLLRQVFINLLHNALKYTRGRTCAVIAVGQTTLAQEQVVFVRDNGAGFDMQYAGKLFGVFQRLHKAKEFEGTGVGLAIAQRIIQKHGGRIWAEAEPEKGATFFFTIPNGSESIRADNGDSGTKRGKS